VCRNCLLKQIIEGEIGVIELTEREGRGSEQLLDDLKETRGYCKLKEELLDILWTTRLGRGCGPVQRQTAE
jgi:hypothetical protein